MEKKYGYEIFYGKALCMTNRDTVFTTRKKAYTTALATVLDYMNTKDIFWEPMCDDLEIYVFEIKEN